MLIIAVHSFDPEHGAGDRGGRVRGVYFCNRQLRLLEVIKNQLTVIAGAQPDGLSRLRRHHIGVRDRDLRHLVAVNGEAGEGGGSVRSGGHIHVVAVVDASDFKHRAGDYLTRLSVTLEDGEGRKHLIHRRDGYGAAAVHGGLIHMGDDRLLQFSVRGRDGYLEKGVHPLGDIGNDNAAVRVGGLRGNHLAVFDHIEHGALNGVIRVIQLDQLNFDLGVVFKNQIDIMLAVPVELLADLVRIIAGGIPIRRSHLRRDKRTNRHGVPGHVLQVAPCAGDVRAHELIVHALDLDDRACQTLGGIVGIDFADAAFARADRGVSESHSCCRFTSSAGQNDILRAGIVDLVIIRRIQFRHRVSRGLQIGERHSSITSGDDFLAKSAVGILHQEPGAGERKVGIGRIHLFDGHLVPLPCDGQVANDDALNIIGRMLGGTGAGVVVLVDFTVAPDALGSQIQNILRPVAQSGPVYNVVNTGVVGVLQIVINV